MKHSYKLLRRVYISIYTNIAQQFKIYVNSLLLDKIDVIENDFWANGNGMLSVRDTESATKFFNSFAMFCYINGGLQYTDRYFFVPGREIPPEIQDEKLSPKELFAKLFWAKSKGLVSASFLVAFLLLFAGKESLWRNFLTELYRNLTVEVLSSDNDQVLEFQALTDLRVEINVRLANLWKGKGRHEKTRVGNKQKL